jgi:hypothetical protein
MHFFRLLRSVTRYLVFLHQTQNRFKSRILLHQSLHFTSLCFAWAGLDLLCFAWLGLAWLCFALLVSGPQQRQPTRLLFAASSVGGVRIL